MPTPTRIAWLIFCEPGNEQIVDYVAERADWPSACAAERALEVMAARGELDADQFYSIHAYCTPVLHRPVVASPEPLSGAQADEPGKEAA